jgi:NAD-dependent protein deacetylase/lipoamidase
MTTDTIQQVADLFTQSKRLLFITGAGVSADSGLPTYRGVGGLYNRGETEDGVVIEQALSGPMLQARPDLTWKYLWQIGEACSGAKPNAAHKIIAGLESQKEDVWVLTQNVDGLHRAAGSQNLVEVHGDMFDLSCTDCGQEYKASELLASFASISDLPPLCDRCQGIIRPNVVLFEEMLPASVVNGLAHLALVEFDTVIAIGTTASFPYIREPLSRAQQAGRPIVEINPTRTAISDHFDYRIELGAAEAMEKIWGLMGLH